MKRILISILFLSIATAVTLLSQGRGTPSNLRVRVDAAGALLTASAAQTNPVTTVQFNNARLAVDSSGNLLTVVSGGSGVGTVTNIATTSPITGGPITTTGTIACPTCVVSGGALGTPSSGTLTSATGLPLTTGVTGTLPIANGGTGVTSLTPASYTSTLTDITIGDGTKTSSQLTLGKIVFWNFRLVFGSTTSLGSLPRFSVPVAGVTAQSISGARCYAIDSSTGSSYSNVSVVDTSTTDLLLVIPSAASALSGNTPITSILPFIWATGDSIQCEGTYFSS